MAILKTVGMGKRVAMRLKKAEGAYDVRQDRDLSVLSTESVDNCVHQA